METFLWMGGRLWLDAVNTEWVEGSERVEGWPDAASLGAWLLQASEQHEEARALRDFARVDDALLLSMKRLRATLRRVCETAHASGEIAPDAVEEINAALRHRGVVGQLEASASGWRERELPSGEASDAPYLLARSVARSLSRGELGRLRPCANPNCICGFSIRARMARDAGVRWKGAATAPKPRRTSRDARANEARAGSGQISSCLNLHCGVSLCPRRADCRAVYAARSSL